MDFDWVTATAALIGGCACVGVWAVLVLAVARAVGRASGATDEEIDRALAETSYDDRDSLP